MAEAPKVTFSSEDGGLAKLAAFIAEQERKPQVVAISGCTVDNASVLLVPQGYEVKSLKPLLNDYRQRPVLRAGTTQLNDLASFIAWTNRHKDAGSVIYAIDNPDALSLTAVIDHDLEGAEAAEERARFGRHRGVYAFPFSREWQEWTKASRSGMGPAEFAEFFERRIADVMPPPYSIDGQGNEVFESQDPEIRKLVVTLGKKFAMPAEIVKLTRGIEINATARANQKIDRDTGEHTIEFSEENGQGVDRVKPPNAFLIAIPVLHNGPPILMAVHLRYRAGNGKVTWFLELHQPERVIEEVFTQAIEKVTEETGLTPLRGVAPKER